MNVGGFAHQHGFLSAEGRWAEEPPPRLLEEAVDSKPACARPACPELPTRKVSCVLSKCDHDLFSPAVFLGKRRRTDLQAFRGGQEVPEMVCFSRREAEWGARPAPERFCGSRILCRIAVVNGVGRAQGLIGLWWKAVGRDAATGYL